MPLLTPLLVHKTTSISGGADDANVILLQRHLAPFVLYQYLALYKTGAWGVT